MVGRDVEYDVAPGHGVVGDALVEEVALDELDRSVTQRTGEVLLEPAAQVVDDPDISTPCDQGIDKVGSDERGSARHQHLLLRPIHWSAFLEVHNNLGEMHVNYNGVGSCGERNVSGLRAAPVFVGTTRPDLEDDRAAPVATVRRRRRAPMLGGVDPGDERCDMKLLITGHLGYIGAEMVPRMLAVGHSVTGLDTGLFDRCDFVEPPTEIPELRVDLRDVVAADLDGFDAVVHLAALSNDPLGDINPDLTYDINLHASVNLARAAKAAGVGRFVFSSSCSLYGAGGEELLDEQAAFHPVTPYGESKVRVEQALSTLADDDFSPVYLRNATAYGVSRRFACRHRREQPRGARGDHRQGVAPQRRHGMAATGAHR